MSSLPHAVVLRVLAARVRCCMIGRHSNTEERFRLHSTVIQEFRRSPRSRHDRSRLRQFQSSTLGSQLASAGSNLTRTSISKPKTRYGVAAR